MRNDYYEKAYIQHELRKNCVKREVSALGEKNVHVRGLKFRSLFEFNRILRLINWDRTRPNLYVSCATLKDIPDFTFNPRERSKETNPWFQNKYKEEIINYDLLFDFDKGPSDSWADLLKEVKEFKEYLDSSEVSYYILFSGNKGFQIVIDGDYIPIKDIREGNVYPHKKLVEDIKEKLKLKFLDLANNGVMNRLRKLPYSIVGENIALPLDNVLFDNFDIKRMNVEAVLSSVGLCKRGNLERWKDNDLVTKRGNVENFIKVFDI